MIVDDCRRIGEKSPGHVPGVPRVQHSRRIRPVEEPRVTLLAARYGETKDSRTSLWCGRRADRGRARRNETNGRTTSRAARPQRNSIARLGGDHRTVTVSASGPGISRDRVHFPTFARERASHGDEGDERKTEPTGTATIDAHGIDSSGTRRRNTLRAFPPSLSLSLSLSLSVPRT